MSSAPVTPRDQISNDYVEFYVPYGTDKNGKLITCMYPLFPNSAAKPDEKALKKPKRPTWTRPANWEQMHVVMPDDGKEYPDGNLEKPDLKMDNVFKKMEEKYPGTSEIVERVICDEDLSKTNAVMVLHYLDVLKEKGAFEDKLTFEHIIAVCKISFDFLEDWAPEKETLGSIVKEGGPDKKLEDVDVIFWKFFKALGYNLTVSKETFDSVYRECNEECNKE
jgi:hypothetical protein